MGKKIKNFLYYAMLEPDQFQRIQPMIANENALALRLACLVQIIYFGISCIGSLGVAQMADKRNVYAVGTLIPMVVLILESALAKRHPAALFWLVRLYCAGLFATGLLCTLISTPQEMTILLLIFFFCVDLLFLVRPLELILLVLCTDIVYFVLAFRLKAPDILTIDMIDVGMFSTLSVILGVTHMGGRYMRYWLEMTAVDVAEIRYQFAFVDQLTGALNRNAYNQDTKDLDPSKVTDDFCYIGLDLNGLKAANDSLGHAAGDELITGAVNCMKQCFEDYGKIYRVGGDEFVVILSGKALPPADILEQFDRLVADWHGDLVAQMSISYGAVTGQEARNMSFHDIELLADRRMYASKNAYYERTGLDRRKNS